MLENNVISVFTNVFLRVSRDLEDLCIPQNSASPSGVSLTRNLFIPRDVNDPIHPHDLHCARCVHRCVLFDKASILLLGKVP